MSRYKLGVMKTPARTNLPSWTRYQRAACKWVALKTIDEDGNRWTPEAFWGYYCDCAEDAIKGGHPYTGGIATFILGEMFMGDMIKA